MSDTYDKRKFGSDKIALLCLFALSLLTARFVVELKSNILLSKPISLPGTGLSISVPIGNGWQTPGQWQRESIDTAILRSFFSARPGEATAKVECRYRPAIIGSSPSMLFEQKAIEKKGSILPIDQIITDSLIFDCAQIYVEKSLSITFIGTAALSENRQLDIEVSEITGDVKQAEKVFRQIIKKVNFEDSRLRTARNKT